MWLKIIYWKILVEYILSQTQQLPFTQKIKCICYHLWCMDTICVSDTTHIWYVDMFILRIRKYRGYMIYAYWKVYKNSKKHDKYIIVIIMNPN